MGVSVNHAARADDKVKVNEIQNEMATHKAKTSDKAYNDMVNKGYLSRVKPGGSTGPTVPPKPSGGSHK
jgi:hypothetical protein